MGGAGEGATGSEQAAVHPHPDPCLARKAKSGLCLLSPNQRRRTPCVALLCHLRGLEQMSVGWCKAASLGHEVKLGSLSLPPAPCSIPSVLLPGWAEEDVGYPDFHFHFPAPGSDRSCCFLHFSGNRACLSKTVGLCFSPPLNPRALEPFIC